MKTKEKEKPKGWANLQQQLKEVREESFKQGIWKGRIEATQDFIKMIDEWYNKYFIEKWYGEDKINHKKILEKLKQKLKEKNEILLLL